MRLLIGARGSRAAERSLVVRDICVGLKMTAILISNECLIVSLPCGRLSPSASLAQPATFSSTPDFQRAEERQFNILRRTDKSSLLPNAEWSHRMKVSCRRFQLARPAFQRADCKLFLPSPPNFQETRWRPDLSGRSAIRGAHKDGWMKIVDFNSSIMHANRVRF